MDGSQFVKPIARRLEPTSPTPADERRAADERARTTRWFCACLKGAVGNELARIARCTVGIACISAPTDDLWSRWHSHRMSPEERPLCGKSPHHFARQGSW
jgi:hypothetical protein